jgi:hypothetical protein
MLMTLAHSRPNTFLALAAVSGVLGVALALVAVHLYGDHVGHHQVVDLINRCLARPECASVLVGK